MSSKFQKLSALNAGDFDHIDGSLIEHLQGTHTLLAQWNASTILQDAGLYHAAYGTDGFEESLVSVQQRQNIAEIIGKDAEEIVYQYCACDRNDFFPRFGLESHPQFRNRFTAERYQLKEETLKQFCELTVANEIEIAIGNKSFIDEHGAGLYDLFSRMAPFLSKPAQLQAETVFARGNL